MGIAERKERERQEMQDRIVQAAKGLFMENGFENTSIRKIAEEIEYSPAAIYRYFQSMDEIFYAVHSEIFDLLYDHIKVVLNGHPIVDYTDPDPDPLLLQKGAIGFQTYGAEGHAGWVKFRNIRIREIFP